MLEASQVKMPIRVIGPFQAGYWAVQVSASKTGQLEVLPEMADNQKSLQEPAKLPALAHYGLWKIDPGSRTGQAQANPSRERSSYL